jgi:hypothetical protein
MADKDNVKLEDMTASSKKFTFGGKEYELSPINLDDLSALKEHIRGKRVQLIQKYVIDVNERIEAMVKVTSVEVNELAELDDFDNLKFILWRSMIVKQPKITMKDVGNILLEGDLTEISAVIVQMIKTPKNPTKAVAKKK